MNFFFSPLKQARVHLLETEPFSDAFGPKKKRKRPNLLAMDYESLVKKADDSQGKWNNRLASQQYVQSVFSKILHVENCVLKISMLVVPHFMLSEKPCMFGNRPDCFTLWILSFCLLNILFSWFCRCVWAEICWQWSYRRKWSRWIQGPCPPYNVWEGSKQTNLGRALQSDWLFRCCCPG